MLRPETNRTDVSYLLKAIQPDLRKPGGTLLCALVLFMAHGAARAQARPAHGAHQRARPLPITDFYDVPKPLPTGKPGELIRSAEFDDYELPYQFEVKRILYHSRSASGADIAVSGVVLVPNGNPRAGGWPLIAWAHGFTGTARDCAPSLMRNVESGPILAMYVRLGYVVVASDYAGMGAEGSGAVMDPHSDATDVINSVAAARAAVPHLSDRWLVMGKSDGGLVALTVNEMESSDSNFLGSVALTGIAQLESIYERLATSSTPGKWLAAIHTVENLFPDFHPSDVLQPTAIPLYEQAGRSCLDPEAETLSASEMLRPDWNKEKAVGEFFHRNEFGLRTARSPILIISGAAQTEMTPAMTETLVARLCQHGDRVQWYQFPGLDPGELIGTSVRDPIAWIQDRFAGHPAPTTCQ